MVSTSDRIVVRTLIFANHVYHLGIYLAVALLFITKLFDLYRLSRCDSDCREAGLDF